MSGEYEAPALTIAEARDIIRGSGWGDSSSPGARFDDFLAEVASLTDRSDHVLAALDTIAGWVEPTRRTMVHTVSGFGMDLPVEAVMDWLDTAEANNGRVFWSRGLFGWAVVIDRGDGEKPVGVNELAKSYTAEIETAWRESLNTPVDPAARPSGSDGNGTES